MYVYVLTFIIYIVYACLDVSFERVGPQRGEMTLITRDSVAARLVPVQIVLPQLLGKHRGVLTVLTLILLGAVDAFNVPVQLRFGLGLERTLVACVILIRNLLVIGMALTQVTF